MFGFNVALVLLTTIFSATATVLHTSSRWILNESNQRVKLRCVNWAGHMETNVPEGLQHQSVSTIASWISSNGFNCVRLTYSIDLALNPGYSVSDSFTRAASPAGVSTSTMQSLYSSALSKNSWLSSSTTLGAFAKVIDELGNKGILVVLDNHVSKASWCCSQTDGNGWWDAASGYTASNSQYFKTADWINGLQAMAKFAASHTNVVGMSLRNELRAVGSQDGNSHADWYTYVAQGASAIHSTNSNLLIMIGGVNYAVDLSYLYSKPFDRSAYGNKIVYEFHNYQWSFSATSCSSHQSSIGSKTGYLLATGKDYTGPLWLSEFGWAQNNPSADEVAYYKCLVEYMTGNDADWSVWALMGSYYVRDKTVNKEETFGLLNANWSGWRNSSFPTVVGKMLQMTQTP